MSHNSHCRVCNPLSFRICAWRRTLIAYFNVLVSCNHGSLLLEAIAPIYRKRFVWLLDLSRFLHFSKRYLHSVNYTEMAFLKCIISMFPLGVFNVKKRQIHNHGSEDFLDSMAFTSWKLRNFILSTVQDIKIYILTYLPWILTCM